MYSIINTKNKKQKTQLKPGFSLIEIVIALAIVSALAFIGYGAFKYLGRAKITQTKSKMRDIQTAITEYRFETNKYPKDLQELVQSGYLNEDETKDAWNQPFEYQPKNPKAKPPYELYSEGDPSNPKEIRLEEENK